YKPRELGYAGSGDFLGRTVERESLVFLSYGLSARAAVEIEAAVHASTSFERATNDSSAVPPRLRGSGFGDLDLQLRWRWSEESERRPELFSYLEATPPLQRSKRLIGTQEWEAALGLGVIRGFAWGTLTARAALAYDGAGKTIELG